MKNSNKIFNSITNGNNSIETNTTTEPDINLKNLTNDTDEIIKTNDTNEIIKTNNTDKTNNNSWIDMKKLLKELDKIGDEKQKEDFILNYSRINEEIKIVDKILNESNDKKIKDFENYSINELFSMLENNENKIFEDAELNIGDFKMLIDICNILENKIESQTMNVIEYK